MNIEVYTDGSATTKDKPGGFGYVIVIDGNKVFEGSGHMDNATNNDAEMEAAIQGLDAVHRERNLLRLQCGYTTEFQVTLVSDSQLILGWVSGAYSFRQQDKIEKYKQLQLLVKLMNVKTRWVEGHTGDEHNERCDTLANQARLLNSPQVKEEIKLEISPKQPDIIVYLKDDTKLYVNYKGQTKQIDLEKNTIVDYIE